MTMLPMTLLLTGAISLASSTTQAQPRDNEFIRETVDESTETWQEASIRLPAMPKDIDLLQFADSAASTHRFAIDAKSLTLDQDGVVRYTLVGVSPSGARNISYEGIRCQTYERKIYASGRSDGTWSAARNGQWMPIRGIGMNRQQASLAQDYFCDNTTVAGKVGDMLNRLQRQATLTGELAR
ncbi:MAG: CNP1-like family protein [Pseudomonadota bacterium]